MLCVILTTHYRRNINRRFIIIIVEIIHVWKSILLFFFLSLLLFLIQKFSIVQRLRQLTKLISINDKRSLLYLSDRYVFIRLWLVFRINDRSVFIYVYIIKYHNVILIDAILSCHSNNQLFLPIKMVTRSHWSFISRNTSSYLINSFFGWGLSISENKIDPTLRINFIAY